MQFQALIIAEINIVIAIVRNNAPRRIDGNVGQRSLSVLVKIDLLICLALLALALALAIFYYCF